MSLHDRISREQKKVPRKYREYAEEDEYINYPPNRQRSSQQKTNRYSKQPRSEYFERSDAWEEDYGEDEIVSKRYGNRSNPKSRNVLKNKERIEEEHNFHQELEYDEPKLTKKERKKQLKKQLKEKKKKKHLKKDKKNKKDTNFIDKNITDIISLKYEKEGLFFTENGCFDSKIVAYS